MKSIFNYFYFNKNERLALFLFLLILLIVNVVYQLLKPSFQQVYYEFDKASPDWLDTASVIQAPEFVKHKTPNRQGNIKPVKPQVSKQLSLDINLSDSLQFTQLHGIGKVFSSRIVRYRNWLGGFHSKKQLLEVYGIDSTLLARISPNIVLASSTLQKININTANYKVLAAHPYISYKMAKSIVKYRDHHGPFKALSDLKGIHLIDEELFRKIAFYIDLE